MADQGFIIPLDHTDFTNEGQRTNWCSAQAFWTNENLLLNGTVDATTAKVGDNVTVQVGIQGVTHGGVPGQSAVRHVQAWVCYPNTVPGLADSSLIVHSMQPVNGGQPPFLDLTSNPQALAGSFNPGDYQNPGTGSYKLFNLTPSWTPSAQDIISPNTTAHCCIIATSEGTADGNDVGLFVNNNNLAAIDICTDPHQAQRNITILPVSGKKAGLHEFGFLSGAARREERTRVTVEIQPVRQGKEVEPAVLRVLRSGPYGTLPLRPAASAPRQLRLRQSPHAHEGWLGRIIYEAEEILEEVVEAIERLAGWEHRDDRHGRRLRLTMPPKGLQPLLFQADLDTGEAPGSVHVFDIVQTDANGRRGGIRVGAVVVP